MTPTILTIIPARGGSKRVPRKNMRLVGGRPLIWWTIEAAKQAGLSPVVSTEDREIGEFASANGCAVIWRPLALASDFASGVSVALHAINACRDGGWTHAVYLQPTSPLRTADDIKIGVEFTLTHDAAVAAGPQGMRLEFELQHACMKTTYTVGKYTACENRRAYSCGAFWGRPVESWLRDESPYSTTDQAIFYMPQERALDTDTEWDLRIADAALSGRI